MTPQCGALSRRRHCVSPGLSAGINVTARVSAISADHRKEIMYIGGGALLVVLIVVLVLVFR
jgi:hypothetical protein